LEECSLDGIYKVLGEMTAVFKDKLNEIKNYKLYLEIKNSRQNKEIFDSL